MGAVVVYDTLWKFSRTGEYRPEFSQKRIDLLITLGGPLGDSVSEGSGAQSV